MLFLALHLSLKLLKMLAKGCTASTSCARPRSRIETCSRKSWMCSGWWLILLYLACIVTRSWTCPTTLLLQDFCPLSRLVQTHWSMCVGEMLADLLTSFPLDLCCMSLTLSWCPVCDIPFTDPCPDFQHSQGPPMQRQACQRIRWFCLSLLCQQMCTVISCMQVFHFHPVCTEFTYCRTHPGPNLVSVSTRLQYRNSPPLQQPRSCSLTTHLVLPIIRSRNSLSCSNPLAETVLGWAFGDLVQSNIKTLDFIAEEGRQPTFHPGARIHSSGAFTDVKPLLE